MHFLLNINLQISESSTVEPIPFDPGQILFGFVFVLGVLTLFTLITAAVGKIFQNIDSIHSSLYNWLSTWLPKSFVDSIVEQPATFATAAAAEPTPQAEILPPQLVAVIAAAVHASMGEQVRIQSIRSAIGTSTTWAAEGRRDIFSSHRIR